MNGASSFSKVSAKRFSAWVVDFLIFISVFTVLIRIFNLFVPGNDIREDAMQLYTEKDFNVLVVTMTTALTMLFLYQLWSYRSSLGQTLGHRVSGVKLVRRGSLEPTLFWHVKLIVLSIIRFLLIVAPGPLMAFFGLRFGVSLFLLFFGFFLVLPIPIRKKPELITLWQYIGGYKFVES